MNIIENYQKAKQAIYDHVGFVEDYVVYPIEIRTEMLWELNDGEVKFAETEKKMNSDSNYYVDEIYTQRFYKKHIYRGSKYTMIFVDTHVDGNKFFAIFDNDKEVNDRGVS